MNLILFDDQASEHLLPFTFTRPSSEIRLGITTIREKWEAAFNASASWKPYRSILQGLYPSRIAAENLFVNARLLPSEELLSAIDSLKVGQALVSAELVLAAKSDGELDQSTDVVQFSSSFDILTRNHQIFSWADKYIKSDFETITKGRTSSPLSDSNKVIGKYPVFLEEGAIVECSVLNTNAGPIYIGKGAEIMENSAVRGPFALCEGSQLKLSSKIYGPTVIGPHSKVGGEVSNSVIFGFTNKAHDGFLGNSVIGEWCNLGADTNNSNLKNNYAEVKLWNYTMGRFESTGLQFCGLIMGDHSKCGINTMFNTGTVVGVAANIFGDGFPRNFIPSFSWGGAQGMEIYKLNKFYETAEKVFARRGMEMSPAYRAVIDSHFEEISAK